MVKNHLSTLPPPIPTEKAAILAEFRQERTKPLLTVRCIDLAAALERQELTEAEQFELAVYYSAPLADHHRKLDRARAEKAAQQARYERRIAETIRKYHNRLWGEWIRHRKVCHPNDDWAQFSRRRGHQIIERKDDSSARGERTLLWIGGIVYCVMILGSILHNWFPWIPTLLDSND